MSKDEEMMSQDNSLPENCSGQSGDHQSAKNEAHVTDKMDENSLIENETKFCCNENGTKTKEQAHAINKSQTCKSSNFYLVKDPFILQLGQYTCEICTVNL